ncbi:hypothetical protein [Streptomyces sp. NPDC048252]|uniref:DUF6230 family protein n=1 Tax=Streptomyces sp. NPDC048252 TaxID=3154612 RepID=UPI00343BBC75
MRDKYAHIGNVAEGRTHWRRSALMFVPCTLAVGALGIALAEGAIAASFAVSGTGFKVSDLRSTAYSANGGTLTLEKLEIEFSRSGKQCF